MGGWLCPSCPYQELLLRCEPREVCAWGWQSPGPVASKDGSPASIFPNLSASSQVMLLRRPSTPFFACKKHPLARPMELGSPR